MIQRVWFEEFRALRKVSIELERLTVFVGPNGSGKTSVLEGISYLLWLTRTYKPVDTANPLREGEPRNTHAQSPMKVGLAFDGDPTTGLELTVTEQPGGPPATTLCATVGPQSSESNVHDTRVQMTSPQYDAARARAGVATFLRLSPKALAEPHYSDEQQPRIDPTGAGLASVINDLASSEPERKEAISAALRKVVPSVRRIRTERAKVTRRETEFIRIDNERVERHQERVYWGQRVLLDTTSGDSIPLSAASEGTVLTLGLMTVLHGRNPPRTLLMDDLDRALHPKAQQDLVGVLRTALRDDPELQILATSHSPFLLDALTHDEVRLTTLADDGSVLCGALRDHPAFEQWKSLVKPGELWTSELEDWLRTRAGTSS